MEVNGFDKKLEKTMTSEAPIGDWIKDFQNSNDPRFDGKTPEQRRQQAIAAWYDFKKKKKNSKK